MFAKYFACIVILKILTSIIVTFCRLNFYQRQSFTTRAELSWWMSLTFVWGDASLKKSFSEPMKSQQVGGFYRGAYAWFSNWEVYETSLMSKARSYESKKLLVIVKKYLPLDLPVLNLWKFWPLDFLRPLGIFT